MICCKRAMAYTEKHILTIASRTVKEFPHWGVRLVAILIWLLGAVNLLLAIQPSMIDRLEEINSTSALEVQVGGHLATALLGFALFLLAGSLWRRKRTGWVLSVLVVGGKILVDFLTTPDLGTLLAGVLLFLLLLLSRSFHSHSDPPSVRQGVIILVSAFLFTLAYGTAGFSLEGTSSGHPINLVESISQTFKLLSATRAPDLGSLAGFSRYFVASVYVVWVVTLGFSLIMIIRPVLVRRPANEEERTRAAAIIEKYGRGGLARAALYEDKSYYFSPGGSVIAYVERGRGVLVLGDPIGPLEDIHAAIHGFKQFCEENDWQAGYMAVLPDHLDIYAEAGFEKLAIGKEAIVALAGFTLQGNKNKNIRQTASKMTRLGYKVTFHRPPLDDQLVRELRKISDAWLSMKVGGELSFTHGWFSDDYIRNGSAFVVYGPDDRPAAFANLIPEYQKNEVTIDMMRRYPHMDNGLMDLLYIFMLEWAKDRGYESFSLGVSPLISVGAHPDNPRLERILHSLAISLNRIYNLQGIHFFKDKFHPQWEPRYLMYPGISSLPSILSAVVRVYSRDNFPWKYLKR
ncbi:MAG: hypothetical protein C3F13_02605 [Anaerolineales bacterium]|nr:MAG: hypothetical protein C3F13_02605 [Anaerolineales bacterium]